jgi:hypothetical protein
MNQFAFTLVLVLAAIAPAQDLSQFDLSTNDGVNAAREALAGKKLDDRSKRCIRRDPSLPGIVVVGSFAYDRGCRLQGAFLNSKYVAADEGSMSRSALKALGWKTATQQQRESLAQAWVEKGLLGFSTVLSVKNEDFANHSFQPPQAVTKPAGVIVITLWVRLPAGRTRGITYQLREYRFLKNGELEETTTIESFTATRD